MNDEKKLVIEERGSILDLDGTTPKELFCSMILSAVYLVIRFILKR